MAVTAHSAATPEPFSNGRRQALNLFAAMLALSTGSARALNTLPDSIVLTLQGQIRGAKDGKHAQFDMGRLAALPQITIDTRTPWYPQPRQFTGPLMRDVLSAGGAQGSRLRLLALNDYQVEMPVDDAMRYDVIVARLLDNKPMTVRDKGPLFIMYPFDTHPELRSAVHYGRCAWQLRAIEIL